jgi:hypothetical protein
VRGGFDAGTGFARILSIPSVALTGGIVGLYYARSLPEIDKLALRIS